MIPTVARMRRMLVGGLLLAWAAAAGAATYHGDLFPIPTRGRLDPATGYADVRTGRWIIKPTKDSNGLHPETEGVWIFVSDTERFRVEPEQLVASKSGTRFRMRDPRATRGVRSLDLRHLYDGRWTIQLRLVQVDLSALMLTSRVCQSIAVIIGDDDAFEGAVLARVGGRGGRRVKADGVCQPGDWPWL